MQTKRLYNFKYSLYNNKWKLLFWSCFFVFGFALGVFLAISSYENCFLFRVQDLNVIQILTGNASSFAAFFSQILSFIIVLSILFLCSLNKFLVCINFVINVYRAYILGFVLTYIVGICNFYGVVMIFLILLPIQILINTIILYISVLSFDESLHRCKTLHNNFFVKLLLISFVVLIAISFIECLLLFVISPKVIFVI